MTPEQVRAAPKVLLHDHLDGGLRPATVVELAGAAGHELPTTDADELGRWFRTSAASGSLPRYLEAFRHTVGVLQTPDALVRAARECAEDLAADGVAYAEVRFAPELHSCGPEAAVEAVLEGFRQGCADRPLRVGTLLTAMRDGDASAATARLAVRYAPEGVVGFDLAGAEDGHPPAEHLEAFRTVHGAGLHCTVHAGEGYGLPSIREALQECHAERLGHGVRIADDVRTGPDGEPVLGPLAAYVRDRRVPLELCPTSNVHTGVVGSVAEHPLDLLRRLRFRVTVSTDNRLMSGVSLSSELSALVDAFGYGAGELRDLQVGAAKSAFLPYDERVRLIEDVLVPGWAV